MTITYTGLLTFNGGLPDYTVTLAGKTLGSVTFSGNLGGNGGWTLQDAFNVGNSTITLTRGSLNTNNQTITCGSFNSSNSNTRSLTLGSSLITCSSSGTPWNFTTVTGLTFNAGTSQIVLAGSSPTFAGGGKTYYNLQLTNTGAGILTISGSNTFNNLTIDTPPKAVNFTVNAAQTINGIFTANGSAGALITFRSTATPTKWTINAASANLSYIDVMDSAGGGAAAPFACGATCVNSGNNTGWGF